MEVFRSLPPLARRRPCALTIGNFDGMHRGHQAIIERLREEARARALPVCVLTFEPHPREYFASIAAAAGRPDISAPANFAAVSSTVAITERMAARCLI